MPPVEPAPAPAPAPMPSAYEERESLGQGGWARTFLAFDARLQRRVVLRRCLAPDPACQARFVSMTRIAAAVDLPWTVRVLSASQDARGIYALYEFHPRGNLAAFVAAGARLDLAHLLAIVAPAGEVLCELHERSPRLLHGRLKPTNVLIARDGRWLLGDFGVDLTPGREVALTEAQGAFVAPELAAGPALVSPASDQYSFARLVASVLASPPTAVDDVLRRASDPQPGNRFASLREFLYALHAATLAPAAAQPAPQQVPAPEPEPEPELESTQKSPLPEPEPEPEPPKKELCPRCSGENDVGVVFCELCGERMKIECPRCGRPASGAASNCSNCGANIAGFRVGERQLAEAREHFDRGRFREALETAQPHVGDEWRSAEFVRVARDAQASFVKQLQSEVSGLLAAENPDAAAELLAGVRNMALPGSPLAKTVEALDRDVAQALHVREELLKAEKLVIEAQWDRASAILLDVRGIAPLDPYLARVEAQLRQGRGQALLADATREVQGFVDRQEWAQAVQKSQEILAQLPEAEFAAPARGALDDLRRRATDGQVQFLQRRASIELSRGRKEAAKGLLTQALRLDGTNRTTQDLYREATR